MMSKKQRLKNCFIRIFPDISFESIYQMTNEEWTSLQMIQLITAVETEFDIDIDLDHLENLKSFSAFLKEIQ